MSAADTARERDEAERVVIHDKRKIRAEGGPAPEGAGAPEAAGDVAPAPQPADDENARLLAERTNDLQRLQAEYANYRRRADRDRAAAGDLAVSRVLTQFLPVLDDLDRARAHGDVTGGLKAIADKLDAIFGTLGLEAFGQVGDPFDPAIHEAVMHDESTDVSVPTCTTVLRPGYRHKSSGSERLLRPALVGVSDPATTADIGPDSATWTPAQVDEDASAGEGSPTADPEADDATRPPTTQATTETQPPAPEQTEPTAGDQ